MSRMGRTGRGAGGFHVASSTPSAQHVLPQARLPSIGVCTHDCVSRPAWQPTTSSDKPGKAKAENWPASLAMLANAVREQILQISTILRGSDDSAFADFQENAPQYAPQFFKIRQAGRARDPPQARQSRRVLEGIVSQPARRVPIGTKP
jgi:hypothetical protein